MVDGRMTATELSTAIVEAIAEREGVGPAELEPPLAGVIDPDALDAIFASSSDARVEFSYAGYLVTVDDGGDVSITKSITRDIKTRNS